MKLNAPENDNYAAVVVKIPVVSKLEGSDNIVGVPLFGFQAIVSKDTQVGDIGIVFPAETQLSDEYCKQNNLYRHSELNKKKDKAGYIEDNRRVKAMKFRGNRSDCLFMPLSSLAYTKINVSELKEGDVFDTLNGREICKKYYIKRPVSRVEKNEKKTFIRVESKYIPEHFSTDNYFRNLDAIKPNEDVVITQKLHGTSIRVGHTIVKRKLKAREQLAKRLGVKVQETEFDYVFGSRKVIKDANNPNQNHFYQTDIWSEEGKKLQGLIPENYLVYGELIGWTREGAAIQPKYTYHVPHQTCDLYIYRIVVINNQGVVTDLAWDQLKEFCSKNGLKTVPELWRGRMVDFKAEDWLNTNFHDTLHGGYPNAVPLDKESPCDEGVCIRVDRLTPYILKAKSPDFLQHETDMLDKEAVDLEAEESIV